MRERLKELFAISDEARWLDDGDYTLHRFLVSRKNNIDEAETMFRNTVQWRTKFDIRREVERWRSENSEERRAASEFGYYSRFGHTPAGAPLNIERSIQLYLTAITRV